MSVLSEGCPSDALNVYGESAAEKAKQGRHNKMAIMLYEITKSKRDAEELNADIVKRQRELRNGRETDIVIDDIVRLSLDIRKEDHGIQVPGLMRRPLQNGLNHPSHQGLSRLQQQAIPQSSHSSGSGSSSKNSENARHIESVLSSIPKAREFWIESFEETTVVPIDRFLFALEMYNADEVTIPTIRLKEMDLQNFKMLLKFNPGLKSLFSTDEDEGILRLASNIFRPRGFCRYRGPVESILRFRTLSHTKHSCKNLLEYKLCFTRSCSS
jgi:hypothetical protein